MKSQAECAIVDITNQMKMCNIFCYYVIFDGCHSSVKTAKYTACVSKNRTAEINMTGLQQ